MPIGASGQWLVDAGVHLLSRADQLVWEQWVAEAGWAPYRPEPSMLPPAVAIVAINALKALVESLQADIRNGTLSQDDALDCLGDIDRATAEIAGLQADACRRATTPVYEIH
ncbi:hypothetical protein [Rhodopila globiformis]|nr:hypothetical protein [Rhodopila globiformis]